MYEKVIALYGVPRSGTSWLGEIIESCPDTAYRFQPLFSYRFKNRITTESSTEDMERFFMELYEEDADDFLNQADQRKKGLYPVFTDKTTNPSILAYKETRYLYTVPLLLQRYENIKIAGIVRNPYDVMESWMNAPLEYKPDWDIEQEWGFAASKNEYRPENYYGYYKWKEWIKLCTDMKKRYPDRFMIIRYEDLSEDAQGVSEKLFEFLQMPFTEQTEQFIENSQAGGQNVESSYSVFRDKKKKYGRRFCLTEEICRMISRDLDHFAEAETFGYRSYLLHKTDS